MSRNPIFLKKVQGTMGLTSLQRQEFNRSFHGFPPNIFTLTFAVGSIVDRFLPDANGQPVLRRMLCLSGGADHAVVDGMDLARFSERFARLLESADGLDDSFVSETRRLKQGASR
jgi:pyruvate/2-oxoglutarate dehydrogenase complex dihydrolipoamide acyltransferase (E2) component